jgi:hypothetical protein
LPLFSGLPGYRQPAEGGQQATGVLQQAAAGCASGAARISAEHDCCVQQAPQPGHVEPVQGAPHSGQQQQSPASAANGPNGPEVAAAALAAGMAALQQVSTAGIMMRSMNTLLPQSEAVLQCAKLREWTRIVASRARC